MLAVKCSIVWLFAFLFHWKFHTIKWDFECVERSNIWITVMIPSDQNFFNPLCTFCVVVVFLIHIFFQEFYHKSHIWKVLIMSRFDMLSQFTFSFKYFITNVTFERFSSWTIVICFLNFYCLSNTLSQISHLKGSHHEQL